MESLLALQAGTVALLVFGACAAVILIFIVIAPWRTIRKEPPLPEDVETRLLLGEDFDLVDRDLDERHPDRAVASELDRGDSHE